MSSFSEPSIITDEKPSWIERWHTAGLEPWSWCMHDRNMRPLFDGGQDQVAQERRARVFARAGRGLHDHRAVGFVRRFHDGAHLFQVVDVERRDAVGVFRGVIQQLTQGYECHDKLLSIRY